MRSIIIFCYHVLKICNNEFALPLTYALIMWMALIYEHRLSSTSLYFDAESHIELLLQHIEKLVSICYAVVGFNIIDFVSEGCRSCESTISACNNDTITFETHLWNEKWLHPYCGFSPGTLALIYRFPWVEIS